MKYQEVQLLCNEEMYILFEAVIEALSVERTIEIMKKYNRID